MHQLNSPTKINFRLIVVDADEGEVTVLTVEDIATKYLLTIQFQVMSDASGDQPIATTQVKVTVNGISIDQVIQGEFRGNLKSRVHVGVNNPFDFIKTALNARCCLAFDQRGLGTCTRERTCFLRDETFYRSRVTYRVFSIDFESKYEVNRAHQSSCTDYRSRVDWSNDRHSPVDRRSFRCSLAKHRHRGDWTIRISEAPKCPSIEWRQSHAELCLEWTRDSSFSYLTLTIFVDLPTSSVIRFCRRINFMVTSGDLNREKERKKRTKRCPIEGPVRKLKNREEEHRNTNRVANVAMDDLVLSALSCIHLFSLARLISSFIEWLAGLTGNMPHRLVGHLSPYALLNLFRFPSSVSKIIRVTNCTRTTLVENSWQAFLSRKRRVRWNRSLVPVGSKD